MAEIKLGDTPVHTRGDLPAVGEAAPDFNLVGTDLAEHALSDYAGKSVVLNIFPSLDTAVCAASVRRFNEIASSRDHAVVLCISADLPFAHKRFCTAEVLDNVVSLSTFRGGGFADAYGVEMVDGKLAGLMSRAVVVVDAHGKVAYTEQVPAIGQEPDYEAALAAL
jgi:thiol peroxidase